MKIIKVIFPKKFTNEKLSFKPKPKWMNLLGEHLRELSQIQQLPEWYREHIKKVRFYGNPFFFSRRMTVKNYKIYMPRWYFCKSSQEIRVWMIIEAVATSLRQIQCGGYLPYLVGITHSGPDTFKETFADEVEKKTQFVFNQWQIKFTKHKGNF